MNIEHSPSVERSLDGWTVQYTVPGADNRHDGLHRWNRGHLEVESGHIHGAFNFVGDFDLVVRNNHGDEIVRKKVRVNSMTGNLEGGDLVNLPGMRAVVRDDCVVTVRR